MIGGSGNVWTDVAALVGAAACLQQIVQWVYRGTVRPKVALIPVSTIEVGYTSLGPIVNLVAAFTAQRRDAIVDRLRMLLRHDQGREIQLTWARLTETPAAVGAGCDDLSRGAEERPAVALELRAFTTVERSVGLHDVEFQRRARILEEAALEQRDVWLQCGGGAAVPPLASEVLANLTEYYRVGLPWEPGVYSVEVELYLLGAPPRRYKMAELRLSAVEVERLRKNLDAITQFYQDRIERPEMAPRRPSWIWVYPTLEGIAR